MLTNLRPRNKVAAMAARTPLLVFPSTTDNVNRTDENTNSKNIGIAQISCGSTKIMRNRIDIQSPTVIKIVGK